LAAIVAASETAQDTPQPSPPPPLQSHERDLPSYARMKPPPAARPASPPESATEPTSPPERTQRPQMSLVTVLSMLAALVSTGMLIWKSM
jgi:hypothetical protein